MFLTGFVKQKGREYSNQHDLLELYVAMLTPLPSVAVKKPQVFLVIHLFAVKSCRKSVRDKDDKALLLKELETILKA